MTTRVLIVNLGPENIQIQGYQGQEILRPFQTTQMHVYDENELVINEEPVVKPTEKK